SAILGWFIDRWDRRLMVVLGLLGTAVAVPATGLAPSLLAEAAVLVVVGVTFSLVLVPTLPELAAAADRAGGGAYALAFAVFNFAYGLGIVLGPFLGGTLMSWLGTTRT